MVHAVYTMQDSFFVQLDEKVRGEEEIFDGDYRKHATVKYSLFLYLCLSLSLFKLLLFLGFVQEKGHVCLCKLTSLTTVEAKAYLQQLEPSRLSLFVSRVPRPQLRT